MSETCYARMIVVILKIKTCYFFDTLKTRLELDYFCNTTISRYRAVARSENP